MSDWIDDIGYWNPDCHYGDHHWGRGGDAGVCTRCGKQLRCACGQFIRADGFEAHFPKCPVYKNIPEEEKVA